MKRTKFKSLSIFEDIEKMFEFYLLSTAFITQRKLQEIMIDNYPALERFIDSFNEAVELKEKDSKINAETKFYLVNTARIMSIAIYDILIFSEYHKYIQREEIFRFVKHIRNGAAHNNKFYFSSSLTNIVTWRDLRITDSLKGKGVFPEFISPQHLIFLMKDISDIIEKKYKKDTRKK